MFVGVKRHSDGPKGFRKARQPQAAFLGITLLQAQFNKPPGHAKSQATMGPSRSNIQTTANFGDLCPRDRPRTFHTHIASNMSQHRVLVAT